MTDEHEADQKYLDGASQITERADDGLDRPGLNHQLVGQKEIGAIQNVVEFSEERPAAVSADILGSIEGLPNPRRHLDDVGMHVGLWEIKNGPAVVIALHLVDAQVVVVVSVNLSVEFELGMKRVGRHEWTFAQRLL